MTRALALAAVLVLPVIAHAHHTVYRWQDASGQLHYSNVHQNVPAYAERLEGAIGRMSTAAIPASARTAPKTAPATAMRPGERRRHAHRTSFCPGGAAAYALTVNGTSLADQVQQASLLDALNVRWRSCR